MRFYKMLGGGEYGDCVRTCIACLIDEEPVNVPHFFENNEPGDVGWSTANAWLLDNRGVGLFFAGAGGEPLADLLAVMAVNNPDQYYILVGSSVNGIGHAVVALGGEIIHDPAFGGSGLVGPLAAGHYLIVVLVPSGQKHAM